MSRDLTDYESTVLFRERLDVRQQVITRVNVNSVLSRQMAPQGAQFTDMV